MHFVCSVFSCKWWFSFVWEEAASGMVWRCAHSSLSRRPWVWISTWLKTVTLVFICRARHHCVGRPSERRQAGGSICHWWSLVDVKDPTVFFLKSRQALFCSCIWQFGCQVAAMSLSTAVPPMLCPSTSTLVLISPTSGGWLAESTLPCVNSMPTGAQTQHPSLPSQPP